MAAVARVPFSRPDERMIRALIGWMLFVALAHVLVSVLTFCLGGLLGVGAYLRFAETPVGAVLLALEMLALAVLALATFAESICLFQTRSALGDVLDSDTHDQYYLSRAFHRLKIYFLLEVGGFGMAAIIALLDLVAAIVAPELYGDTMGHLRNR